MRIRRMNLKQRGAARRALGTARRRKLTKLTPAFASDPLARKPRAACGRGRRSKRECGESTAGELIGEDKPQRECCRTAKSEPRRQMPARCAYRLPSQAAGWRSHRLFFPPARPALMTRPNAQDN